MVNAQKIAHDIVTAELMDENVKILDLPDLRQFYNYDCGCSSVQSVLAYYGFDFREDSIMKFLEADAKNGVDVKMMKKIFKQVGLDFISRNNLTFENLKTCIDHGYPVIVLLQAWADDELLVDWTDNSNGHYVVAIGYQKNKIIFEDPSAFERVYLLRHELDNRWIQKDEEGNFDHFGIVVIGVPEYNHKRINPMK